MNSIFFKPVAPFFLCLAILFTQTSAPRAAKPDFDNYVESLYPAAAAAGVTWETFERATKGLKINNKLIGLTKQQPEFKRSIGQYIDKRIAGSLIANGKTMARKYAQTLSSVERRYGVDPYIVVAIWGMETNYGGYIGNLDIFQSLATLAYIDYRRQLYEQEFINALLVMQQEKLDRNRMRGSWAGAVGQTQFMPSSFLRYAVDHNGDGRRDLWQSTPDALASAANYLKQKGWQKGVPWGYQVDLPDNVDLMRADDSFANWKKRGVRRTDGGALPVNGNATLFFPSGIEGLAFLVTGNFFVIKEYNFSDAYALAVAHLADLIAGRSSAFKGTWNVELPLNKQQRIDSEVALKKMGYPVPRTDGRVNLPMRAVVRSYQHDKGMVPDGHLDADVYRSIFK
jgi:lytic murein transglycosylase